MKTEKLWKNNSSKSQNRSAKRQKIISNIAVYFVLTLLAIYILIPFYVILITSVKTTQEANYVQFTWWPKDGFDFSNYATVFTDETAGITLLQSFGNTLWMSLLPTFVGVFVSALSAYGFSKLEFRFKKTMFSILMMTMMIPGCITMSASFMIFDKIGWVDTPLPLIIPGMFGGIGIVFFLRQFMMGIPDSLLDAAKVEGMGVFGVFITIVLPLSYPAVLAQFILTFIGRYNEYLNALIYLFSPDWYTLQIALTFYNSSTSSLSLVATACVISIVPLLLIYFGLQNYILKGISVASGLKG